MDIEVHGCDKSKSAKVSCLNYLKLIIEGIEKNKYLIQDLSLKRDFDVSYAQSGIERDIGDRILIVKYNIFQKRR
ncbi:hypothetical protein ES705_46272 [subsurface metagenome]